MNVTVRLLSGADHLSQILTGFQMLSRENKLIGPGRPAP